MVKTITITGEETAVKFDTAYQYFWALNLGNSDVYMSLRPGIVPNADGVTLVPAGGGGRTEKMQSDTLYLLGSGTVHISGQYDAFCPFFKASKGGGENATITPCLFCESLIIPEIIFGTIYEEV